MIVTMNEEKAISIIYIHNLHEKDMTDCNELKRKKKIYQLFLSQSYHT